MRGSFGSRCVGKGGEGGKAAIILRVWCVCVLVTAQKEAYFSIGGPAICRMRPSASSGSAHAEDLDMVSISTPHAAQLQGTR